MIIMNNRTLRALFLASAVVLLSGCLKKSGQGTGPESPDTLPETIDTLSETHDTLSATTNTLPITFDTLTDTRDGKTYRTVKIGNQVLR